MAPMTAVPPTFINFLKLKSSPKANNRKITAYISPDTDTFHICNCRYLLDGRSGEYSGYDIPNTTGCFNFLNNRVTNPADMSMTARSDISAGI